MGVLKEERTRPKLHSWQVAERVFEAKSMTLNSISFPLRSDCGARTPGDRCLAQVTVTPIRRRQR